MEYIAIKNIERLVFGEKTNTLIVGLTSGNAVQYDCAKDRYIVLIKLLSKEASEWSYIDIEKVINEYK